MDFHIFTRKNEAAKELADTLSSVRFVLLRVQYREAHTVGRDMGCRVVVAKQMRMRILGGG